MKRANLRAKEKSSFFVISRGLIIATMLVTCSFGFVVGYLVGKSSTNKNLQDKNVPPINRQGFLTSPVEESTKQVQSQAPSLPKEVVPKKEMAEAKNEAREKPQQPRKPSIAVYTVQVGAFKNVSDADALKARLDKKGYNAYVALTGSKKEERLYKVWIGEFNNRKKADKVSMKIKKAEGLQTFVTIKRGWESIR